MRKRILCALIVFTTLAAYAAPPRKHAAAPAQARRSNAARPSMLVPTSWLAAHLSDRNLVVLHVGRDRRAYDAAHIPGARFLPIGEIAVTRNGVANELPSAKDLQQLFARLGVGDSSFVVLYGESAGPLAARAYFTLDAMGHGANAALLDGGWEKWSQEHGADHSFPPPVAPAVFTVHARPDLVVDLTTVKLAVANKNIPLIDARPPSDFAGDGSYRSGHIPGARNVYWGENLVSSANPVLKPLADIRARYAATGLKSGAKVIVYCHSGMQASYDYFTLKLAGFRPVLYDASFMEWSRAASTQVESGTGWKH